MNKREWDNFQGIVFAAAIVGALAVITWGFVRSRELDLEERKVHAEEVKIDNETRPRKLWERERKLEGGTQ